MRKNKQKKNEKNEATEMPIQDALPTTAKKYLNQVEQIVRRMDNVLLDLNKLQWDAVGLYEGLISTDVDPKDFARFNEIQAVLGSATCIIYHLTERMARKYVGKEIGLLDVPNRKSLKKLGKLKK